MKHALPLVTAVALMVTACAAQPSPSGDPEVVERTDAIRAAVDAWRDAATIDEAREAAEEARNLIVGPGGPLYGDASADGTTAGASDAGLLTGADGTEGLANMDDSPNACVERDVLGGSWDDPQARWDEALAVYGAWSPSDNTMPQLASHPMRVVGWATLTLETDSLDTAREHAGHAQLHVDITRDAYVSCG